MSPLSVPAPRSLGAGLVAVAAAAALATACSAANPPAAPAPSVTPAAPAAHGAVDKDRAGALATGHYGGRVLNVEPDTEHGVPVWEVEVADSRQGRIEVNVARADGRVVAVERD